MRKAIILISIIAVLGFGFSASQSLPSAQEAFAKKGLSKKGPAKKVNKPFNTEKRELWTSSKIFGTPDPPAPYKMELAFPNLQFYEPLAMGTVPGTNRLVIAERKGRIYTFVNDAKNDRKELLIDLSRTIYGVALHPKFTENGYFYVMTLPPDAAEEKGSRVSRFQATGKDRLSAKRDSEEVVLEWPTGGHNGGCLRFGPDGYLYLAVGDGSGIADGRETGQDLSDWFGSILRIDVDHRQSGKTYAIPKDNPFVNIENAKDEIYSFGHRQVWKFSWDQANGDMWAGEVGQDLWEMVYKIKKGANYGWSVMEGAHPFRPDRKKGPAEFEKPIVEHNHDQFRSITGGFIYHGSRLPELKGAYIYGDYDTGRIWSVRYDGQKVTEHRELVDTQMRVVEFGQDDSGEVFVVDFVGGRIYRLAPAPKQKQTAKFPRKLSETGLFASTKDHTPAKGLIPYSVNAPLWSDGAGKDRFLALPGDSKIEFNAVTYPQPSPGSQPGWRMPDGAVLVKTFELEMESGNPASSRRLETRILHHVRMPGNDDEYGAQVWRGYTYVWNEEQTDAELLDTDGLTREYTIKDAHAPGGKRKQTWRFPSRAECTLCHTMSSKYVLGLNSLQMNRDHDYGGVVANQLSTLEKLGVFTKPLPKLPQEMPKLVDYRDSHYDLNRRARSYLHANCAHCHRKWGGGNAEFQLLAALPWEETGTIDTKPGQGTFKLDDPRLFVAGHPDRSLIYQRMLKVGLGRMPHVGSNEVDQEATELIKQWITGAFDGKYDKKNGID